TCPARIEIPPLTVWLNTVLFLRCGVFKKESVDLSYVANDPSKNPDPRNLSTSEGKQTGSSLNSLRGPFEQPLSPNAEVLPHCAAIALCRPTGGGSQRETKKQASPIATKSSSKATKM